LSKPPTASAVDSRLLALFIGESKRNQAENRSLKQVSISNDLPLGANTWPIATPNGMVASSPCARIVVASREQV
jgi:hypothetical protein